MRILILGDSLGLPRPHRINNYSPLEQELAVSYEQTYSSIIQRSLLESFKLEPYFEVINRSRRFCTLRDIDAEFADYLFFYEPDIIVLQIGIVDCWFREGRTQMVNSEDFQNYLNNILKMLSLRQNCFLIIVGISPTSSKMDERHSGLNAEISKYNQIYKAVVDNKRIFYIDMEQYVDPTDVHKYLLPDDHHLNPDGNQLVANDLLRLIYSLTYNKAGFQLHQQKDIEGAFAHFELAFKLYPYNVDNIYNYILMLHDKNETEQLRIVTEFCKENISDPDIAQLLLECNLQ